jgi:hypothetical protein
MTLGMGKVIEDVVAKEAQLDASLSTPRWMETRRDVTSVATRISVMGVNEWLLQRELAGDVLSSRRSSGTGTGGSREHPPASATLVRTT